MQRARQLMSQGRQQEAIAAVEAAARERDPEAMLAVAHWRLFGVYGERDLDTAHRLFADAGEAGSVEAVRLRATLVANGTGCSSDPALARAMLEQIAPVDANAAHQLALLAAMPPPGSVAALSAETLCRAPSIRLVRGLLSADECRYIITAAGPLLQPSFVVDPVSGRRIPHPVRTSYGMNFGPTQEDPVIHQLNRRIAAATGTEVSCGEPLHVLRYRGGQEYRPHFDALPGAANQRSLTALIYLNEDYAGGETLFDRLELSVRGRMGDALVFDNIDAEGLGDERSRHAGLPVSGGEKWLATRWIRQRPYDALAAVSGPETSP